MTSLLVHISSSPFTSLSAKEGLDIALVMATFEQAVDLYLSGPALSILQVNQAPSLLHGKNLSKALPSLELYDIENVYVCKEDISHLNKTQLNIWDGVHFLDSQQWQQKLQSYQHILRF
ncbi:DsrE family protein [Marinomonas sp. 15G1-11]|uniref:DsrE family protein n=1 Tax=Marinomonas phaeophyticola TaxID=3004091 RepID=A0ABT4JYC8_9GAMM|nr:DsrE family protein [Marinomonas sp. 15G1-11]MCZ2723226.1 DsrE family protein [Marinomonas sp. 15G1-11]